MNGGMRSHHSSFIIHHSLLLLPLALQRKTRRLMSSRRQLRVGELLQHELAQMIAFDLRDPRLAFVSVMRVQVSSDLLHAAVYVSQLAGENSSKETLAALEHARGFLRRELALRTKLRHVPDLKFHYDEGLAEGMRINALIDEIAPSHDEAAGRPAEEDQ